MKRPDGARPAVPAAALDEDPGPRAGQHQDPAAEAEHCEMCAEVLTDRHGHLVDTEKRSLACACRACYLLFTHEGAAGGRYRAVPERIRHDPERPLTDADWNELQIPVAMAFFFYNSALGRVVAGYPSPGGTTECELDLAAWDRLAAAYPLLGEMAPDVEAILVNRTDGATPGGRPPQPPPRGHTPGGRPPQPPPRGHSPGGRPPQTPPDKGNEVFLIPIDECYSLVGKLRLLWQGFDGGAEVRAALATFLEGLRQRAVAGEREH